MEQTQNANVLNYPLHENSKFNNLADKYPGSPASTSEFSDSSFLSSRSSYMDRPFNAKSNSSPHRYEPSHQHFEEKKAPEQISGHELMRQAGIGRGKHRARNSPISDVISDNAPECKSISTSEGALSSAEFPELASVKAVCNIEAKKTYNLPVNDQTESVQNNGMAISEQKKPNEQKDIGVRNSINSTDNRFREHDYRRLHNGVDSTNKNFNKGRNYKLRYPSNGAVHYNRIVPHFPLAPNMKAMRTIKPNDSFYRQNDPRRNQPSKPFSEIDKLMYAKHRPNMCMDKDIPVYDTNRNVAHYSINKNDMNNHVQLPESYMSHVNSAGFRRKSFVGKIDPVNSKQWSNNNRIYSDANTSTSVCHRAAVPSNKMGHSGSTDKDGGNCTFVSKTDSCDSKTMAPDLCATSCDKESVRLKANCSSLSVNQYSNTPGESAGDVGKTAQVSMMNFPSADTDQSSDTDFAHYHSPVDGDLVDKSLCEHGPIRCNSQRDKLSSHPQSNEYVTLSDQPLASDTDTMQNSVTFSTSNGSSSMGGSVASYADIIRSPAMTMNKLALSPVFHPSNAVMKTDTAMASDIQIPEDAEPPNSSEWIMSRLSQVNLDSVQNGMVLQQASAGNHSLQSRPIAVSVEKPSFYNTKGSLQSSLSSPDKRMLECHLVEEHLCNILTKEDKLSFISESPATFPSPKQEHSPNAACANTRTDSLFSDSSSVCSSASSSTFKLEAQHSVAESKSNIAPVVIMKNCMPLGMVSDISFGIELDEIMQICSDSPGNSKDESVSVSDVDSGLAKNTRDDGLIENCASSENLKYLTIGAKKLLWREKRLDVNKCNMGHIVDFMHNAWQHVETTKKDVTDLSDGIKYYTCE